jgi:ribosomal protein L16/L10AE
MSTGMQHAFGNPISSAARIKKGQTIVMLKVNKANIDLGKTALKRAGAKLPCGCMIVINEVKK